MGKTYKKDSGKNYSNKELKETTSRSIRNRNKSNDLEQFTNKTRSFKYENKIKKIKQYNPLINDNKFNKYNYNYIYSDYSIKNNMEYIINRKWNTEYDNQIEFLYKQLEEPEFKNITKQYIKTSIKQLERRGKTDCFKGHHKEKKYETILHNV